MEWIILFGIKFLFLLGFEMLLLFMVIYCGVKFFVMMIGIGLFVFLGIVKFIMKGGVFIVVFLNVVVVVKMIFLSWFWFL